MRAYKLSRSRLFLFKNCSVCENGNLGLKKIRTSCYFCVPETAFIMTLLQLEIANIRKVARILRLNQSTREIAEWDLEEQELIKQLVDEEWITQNSVELDSDSDYDGGD